MRFRFTIRDLLWLILLVAIAIGFAAYSITAVAALPVFAVIGFIWMRQWLKSSKLP